MLIRVSADTGVKFVWISSFFNQSAMNEPVKPPKKPKAVDSVSIRFKIRETLIPLPPGNLKSFVIRFKSPICR